MLYFHHYCYYFSANSRSFLSLSSFPSFGWISTIEYYGGGRGRGEGYRGGEGTFAYCCRCEIECGNRVRVYPSTVLYRIYHNVVILTCSIVEASGKPRESSESSECAWGRQEQGGGDKINLTPENHWLS